MSPALAVWRSIYIVSRLFGLVINIFFYYQGAVYSFGLFF